VRNTRSVDPALKSNYLLENRNAKVTRVLTNSFGFGGSNCSLVLGLSRDAVFVEGVDAPVPACRAGRPLVAFSRARNHFRSAPTVIGPSELLPPAERPAVPPFR